MTYYILNEDGSVEECALTEWSIWRNRNAPLIIIKQDTVNDNFISTVFLGVSYKSNIKRNPPLLFETMVFDKGGAGNVVYEELYSTKKEALEGHKKAVEYSLT